MSEEKQINQNRRPEARLYNFLLEIYGDQPAATRIEVDVEALSGGEHGTPHLEATNVRVYAGEAQLLPDFEGVPYWKEMLVAFPNLFQDCTTHQDRLDTVQELLERERLYLEYGLDWPHIHETFISPLCFTIEELRQMASSATSETEELSESDWDGEEGERSPEETIACAESALTRFSEEWIQREFGYEITDILFDALNELIAKTRLLLALQGQEISSVSRVFHAIWDNPGLREVILKNVRHELSREGSVNDVYDVLLQVLEDENLPSLSDVDLRNMDLDPFVDFLIAYVGKVPLDPEYLAQNGFDQELLSPRVTASCHSDDFVVEVKEFDATPWLAQASDDELRALRNEGYGGNYTADSVAEFMATYDSQVQAIFDHNATLPASVELRGFECSVNEEEAEAWIAQHRPHLLTEEEEETD